jgi:hypothetical protein
MIPFSLSWDTQKKSVSLKWDGFLSMGWEKGKVLTKILGLPIPFNPRPKKTHFSMRWVYLKEVLSFLKEWRLKKIEGTVSLPDPMMNGMLYGWMSAFEAREGGRKIDVSINFLGVNRFSGEAVLSPRVFFNYLKRWVLLLLKERRGRRPKRGGEKEWKQPI